ncbi:MAG: response regulator [Kofleriaceae bacterium]
MTREAPHPTRSTNNAEITKRDPLVTVERCRSFAAVGDALISKTPSPQLSNTPLFCSAVQCSTGCWGSFCIVGGRDCSARADNSHERIREETVASILVVDDAATSRDIMGRVLSSLGHMVNFATDGIEALPKAKEVKPDIVLMDIVMPRMDGFKAMRTLKDDPATSGIPVVLVSTKNNDSDIFWGKKQGAAEYLPKPFTEQSLVAVVHKILGLATPVMAAPASTPTSSSPSIPAPSGGGGKSQATLDAISAAYLKAVGPFGKVAFKRELGNLGVPVELFNKSHAHALVSALSASIPDASARRDFDATCRQYT